MLDLELYEVSNFLTNYFLLKLSNKGVYDSFSFSLPLFLKWRDRKRNANIVEQKVTLCDSSFINKRKRGFSRT